MSSPNEKDNTIRTFKFLLPLELVSAFKRITRFVVCSVKLHERIPDEKKDALQFKNYRESCELLRQLHYDALVNLKESKHALISTAVMNLNYEPQIEKDIGIEGLFVLLVTGLERHGLRKIEKSTGLEGMYSDYVQTLVSFSSALLLMENS